MAFRTTGQRCTAASRVIVHEQVRRHAREAAGRTLREDAHRARMRVQTSPGPCLGLVKAAMERMDASARIGKTEGATLLTGGSLPGEEQQPREGFYYPANNLQAWMRTCSKQERSWDPRSRSFTVQSFDGAIEVTNSIRYRAYLLDLHPRCQQGVPRDARTWAGSHT